MTGRYTVRPLSAEARLRMSGHGQEHSPFSAAWSKTETLLYNELRALGARDVILMVNASESDIRLDGQLRANARPATPHVAIAFESRKKGSLLFCCGRYRTWQDNVRAIALGLEALRKIERYGITQSDEQYEGWRAIGAGTPDPVHVETDEQRAWNLLCEMAGVTISDAHLDPQGTYRLAVKQSHPDQGGAPAAFHAVQAAARLLGIR